MTKPKYIAPIIQEWNEKLAARDKPKSYTKGPENYIPRANRRIGLKSSEQARRMVQEL